jgi:predicted site-specific integrase-resolvase
VEKYLKASEVAGRYGVKPITVKRWIKNGLLPNAKYEETVAGSIWLIPETDLKNFKPPAQGRPRKSKF